MATEERAKRLRGTCEFLNDKFRDGYEKGLHDGCFMGAHLQKKIDIDKACVWLVENLGYYNRNEVHIGKSYEQCVIDDFRRALEE